MTKLYHLSARVKCKFSFLSVCISYIITCECLEKQQIAFIRKLDTLLIFLGSDDGYFFSSSISFYLRESSPRCDTI